MHLWIVAELWSFRRPSLSSLSTCRPLSMCVCVSDVLLAVGRYQWRPRPPATCRQWQQRPHVQLDGSANPNWPWANNPRTCQQVRAPPSSAIPPTIPILTSCGNGPMELRSAIMSGWVRLEIYHYNNLPIFHCTLGPFISLQSYSGSFNSTMSSNYSHCSPTFIPVLQTTTYFCLFPFHTYCWIKVLQYVKGHIWSQIIQ